MSTRADALILPADTPVSEVEIKKALLFFDSVTLPNPADYALVNEGEKEIESGNYITNEDLDLEIRQWLTKN